MKAEITAAVTKAISEGSPMLCPADAKFLCKLAEDLVMNESAESAIAAFAGNITEAVSKAVAAACNALKQYRTYTRANDGAQYAATVPVRKAVPAGEGGGRYYWRALMPLPGGGVVACVKWPEKNSGTYAQAKAYARDCFCRGIKVVELIPPDIDPQQAAIDERQRNTAEVQPAGMTVRQRTKKH